jgi:hypothetical protein
MNKANLHYLIDELPDDVISRVERGDPVMLVMRRDGERLLLHEIDPEQWWFWTPEWQAGEREVDEAIARGERGRIFLSDEEFLAHLDSIPPADK